MFTDQHKEQRILSASTQNRRRGKLSTGISTTILSTPLPQPRKRFTIFIINFLTTHLAVLTLHLATISFLHFKLWFARQCLENDEDLMTVFMNWFKAQANFYFISGTYLEMNGDRKMNYVCRKVKLRT